MSGLLCANCQGTASKQCGKCKSAAYCSRECQRKDWKAHKKTCGRASGTDDGSDQPSAASGGRNPFKFQVHSISDPASLAKELGNDFLHNVPQQKVYARLIDSYRIRIEDTYVMTGEAIGLYGGENPLVGFREFLDLAESREGLLPPWWSRAKRMECVKLGTTKDQWSDLSCGVEKPDIQEHYKDPMMPMKLRVLNERIYGDQVGM